MLGPELALPARLIAEAAKAKQPSPGISHTPAVVIADIAVIIAAARLMGFLFRKIGQPSVVGEIVGGILLGPSLLGAFPGHLTTKLFPGDSVPHLQILAQLGVVLFMFIVGLELDLRVIRGRVNVAAGVSLSSIVLPMGLGVLLAVFVLHPHFKMVNGHSVRPLSFALFIGASMSITAFPVLARILGERRMQRTTLGTLALASAAVDDLMAWSLLALVIGIVTSKGTWGLPLTLLETVGLVLGLTYVIKPLLNEALQRWGKGDGFPIDLLAITLIGLLGTAALADKIGVDLIFGGFVFGATFPKRGNEEVVGKIVQRVESLSVTLLLPIFFMVTGLSVNVRTIGASGLGYLVAILAVAIGGKFLGATVAARTQGLTGRQSAAMGTLMNTRGLTELIILNVGKSLGVLSPKLYTLMVIMAVVTTAMTDPVLRLVYPKRFIKADLEEAERRLAGGDTPGYKALAVLEGTGADPLGKLAADLVGPGGTVHLASYLPSHSDSGGSALAFDLQGVAAAVDDLQRHGVSRAGVDVRHLVKSTADPVAEVLEQIQRSDVDVLVIGANHAAATRLLAEAPCHVVLYDAGSAAPTGTVTVVVRDGVDNDTAMELGARIAMGRPDDTGLHLTPNEPHDAGRARRLGERAAAISSLHERVSNDDEVATGTLLVVDIASALASRSSNAAAVIAVRSGDEAARVNLDQRFERLANQAAASSLLRGGVIHEHPAASAAKETIEP